MKPKPKTESGISETVSKKGRPARYRKESRVAISSIYPDVKTVRGKLNLLYRTSACQIIKAANNPKLNWLFDTETQSVQLTILNELGKLDSDPESLLAIAERLCELKPKTRDAVAMIRNFRLGEREPNVLNLTNEIIHTVNDYWKRFPKLTKQQILTALENAYHLVEQTPEAPKRKKK